MQISQTQLFRMFNKSNDKPIICQLFVDWGRFVAGLPLFTIRFGELKTDDFIWPFYMLWLQLCAFRIEFAQDEETACIWIDSSNFYWGVDHWHICHLFLLPLCQSDPKFTKSFRPNSEIWIWKCDAVKRYHKVFASSQHSILSLCIIFGCLHITIFMHHFATLC